MKTGARDESHPPPVLVEERDALAVIRINRPAQRNSLSAATLEELEQAFVRLTQNAAQSDRLKAVIFTGTGDVFASGADINELRALTPDSAREFAARGQRLFNLIAEARPLTVAAVNGYCMGGGLDLALSCRLRVASPRAVFAHPGARLGIITGWGGTQRLPQLVGTARAVELFTTSKRLSAEEAYEIGLVSRVCEPVLDSAQELVKILTG